MHTYTMIGPVKKRSISKKKTRHSSWKREKMSHWLKKIQTRWSPEGQCWKLNHRVCPKSWFYKGKQVISINAASSTVIEA